MGTKNINIEYIPNIFLFKDSVKHLVDKVVVKYLDQQDIEELGWTYTGKSTELWFGIPKTNVQPFNLTYRSFRLSYNLTDYRCYIIGYEYSNYVGEDEPLFLGKIKNYNELKQVMKFLNII